MVISCSSLFEMSSKMVMIEFFAEKNSIFSDRYPRVIPEAV
jgi:hypothetical protein